MKELDSGYLVLEELNLEKLELEIDELDLNVGVDRWGLPQPQGAPIRGPRAGPRGGTSQMWGQGGSCCCQGWTLEVDRGSHSLRGNPIRGPGAWPSGGNSE